jgi:hypothetical protein
MMIPLWKITSGAMAETGRSVGATAGLLVALGVMANGCPDGLQATNSKQTSASLTILLIGKEHDRFILHLLNVLFLS